MCINNTVKLALEKMRKGFYLLDDSIDDSKDRKNSKMLRNILNGEGINNCTQNKYRTIFEDSLSEEVSGFSDFVDFFFDKYHLNFELSREDDNENSIKKLVYGLDLIIEGAESLKKEVENTLLLKEVLQYDIIYDFRIIKSPFRRLNILILDTKFTDFKAAYLKDIKNIIGEEDYGKEIGL